MNAVDLWRAKVPTHSSDGLAGKFHHENIIAIRLGPATGVKYMQVSIWRQKKLLSKSSGGCSIFCPALLSTHHLLSSFYFFSRAVLSPFFLWSSTYSCNLLLCGALQNNANETSGTTSQKYFRTVTRWEKWLCIVVGLLAASAARKRVSRLDKSILKAFCKISQSFVARLQPTDTLVMVLAYQTQYQCFDFSHRMTGIDTFSGETTVWISSSLFSKPGPSVPIKLWLQSHLPFTSPMLIKSPIFYL